MATGLEAISSPVTDKSIVEVMPDTLTDNLKRQAIELGFVLTGVTPAAAPQTLAAFHQWLDSGMAGQMHYLENRRAAYGDPRLVLDGCRTIVMLALPYRAEPVRPPAETERQPDNHLGKVARYARSSADYHDVIHGKLKSLKRWLLDQRPEARVRGVVDTAPLLERDYARQAGLGWVGKNTLLLNKTWGSYFFLAALLTDLQLDIDEPARQGHCGTCTACLQACPTQAFPSPFVLDARRCISYLTIEHHGNVSEELSHEWHGWLFGCDICQEVCPWNRRPARRGFPEHLNPPLAEPAWTNPTALDLASILIETEESFRQQFKKTALWRSGRQGLIRNALLLIGQSAKNPDATDQLLALWPLVEDLLDDQQPTLRCAAAWALSQSGLTTWRESIAQQITREVDSEVLAYLHSLTR